MVCLNRYVLLTAYAAYREQWRPAEDNNENRYCCAYPLFCILPEQNYVDIISWMYANSKLCFNIFRKLRYIGYRQYVRLIYGFLGRDIRLPLPSCVLSAIRRKWPSSDGKYAPYQGMFAISLKWYALVWSMLACTLLILEFYVIHFVSCWTVVRNKVKIHFLYFIFRNTPASCLTISAWPSPPEIWIMSSLTNYTRSAKRFWWALTASLFTGRS